MTHTKEEFARVLKDRLVNSRLTPVGELTALQEKDPEAFERQLKQDEDENIIVAALGIVAGGKFVGTEATAHFRRCIAHEMEFSSQQLKRFAMAYEKAGNGDAEKGQKADELMSVLIQHWAEKAIKYRTLAEEYDREASTLRKEADEMEPDTTNTKVS